MDFGGVSCFPKTNHWAQLPELWPRSVNATTAPAPLFAPGPSLWLFSQGYPVPPTHNSILSRPDGCLDRFTTGRSETNLRNDPENIVRTEGVKIVTRYTQAVRRNSKTTAYSPGV